MDEVTKEIQCEHGRKLYVTFYVDEVTREQMVRLSFTSPNSVRRTLGFFEGDTRRLRLRAFWEQLSALLDDVICGSW